MVIGVPRERKIDEHRVALLPRHVSVLVSKGHRVLIEEGAGTQAGFSDCAYTASGAELVSQAELYQQATLVVKVKCPRPEEYEHLTPQHVLFTYLHFDECIPPFRIQQIVDTGATGIAYEWVREDNRYPLLEPMSALTGVIAALKSMELLMKHKGRLPVRATRASERPRALILGGGRIGLNATSTLARNAFAVTIVDKHPQTLAERYGQYISPTEWRDVSPLVTVLPFDEHEPEVGLDSIRNELPETDIVICAAVRRSTLPPDRCRYLLDRSALKLLAANSVVCDATACDADLVETCVSSERLEEISIIDGVVHYCCDHMPAYIPHTASVLLSDVTFPYVQLLASGVERALAVNEGLREAVMCRRGHLTHPASAVKKQLPWRDVSELVCESSVAAYGR
jgi:alanine dehydrogenase